MPRGDIDGAEPQADPEWRAMGYLMYTGMIVDFDDRILAHLQIVIVQKLRRGESPLLAADPRKSSLPHRRGEGYLVHAAPLVQETTARGD